MTVPLFVACLDILPQRERPVQSAGLLREVLADTQQSACVTEC
jgi:hypothetical protein